MDRRRLTVFFLTAALSACAATVKKGTGDSAVLRIPPEASAKLVLVISGPPSVTGASDFEGFKEEWREAFADQTRLAGIAFQMRPTGDVRASGDAGTLVSLQISDYRFMRPGTRYGIGIYGGNAYIESRIAFLDLKTGRSFGEQEYNTSSTAWQGIFSAVTNKQTQAIAAEVVRQLKGGK